MSMPDATPSASLHAPPMYFCHTCSMEIRPLMTPNPTCPRCNEGFVEEIDASTGGLQDDGGEEEAMPMYGMEQARPFMGATRRADIGGAQDPAMDWGTLFGGIMRGLATAGSQPRPPGNGPSETASRPQSHNPNAGDGGSSSSVRTGTTQVGPLNFSWGVGSMHASGTTGRRTEVPQSASNMPYGHAPPMGLNEYVRQSFENDPHHHDDGMGGAGAAADGRFFNRDNQPSARQSDRYGEGDHEQGIPPELASLRDLFTNLFGGMGEGPANMLVDLFGGGQGRTGDYVWGQQGLDDVITQLMEQTRGSTAPPPASEEAIQQLDRFSRKDLAKVRQARNRECSTCMDSFEEESDGSETVAPEPSLDSNRLSSTLTGASADDDDPPETVPLEEQQDELIMMPCKHLFHLDCLLPWLRSNGTCPVCRVSLVPEKDKKGLDGAAETSTSGSQGVHPPTRGDDNDVDDESPADIRERSRRAAEARAGGSSSNSEQRQPIPGDFLQPDELD